MTTETTNIPDWLAAAIDKYNLVPTASIREIFDVFFENNTVESPRFRKLCERLVRLKKVKKRFITTLEVAGYFDDDEDTESENVAEDEDLDEDEEEIDDAAEFEEDEESDEDDEAEYEDDEEEEEEDELEDSDDEELEEEELEDDEEEEEEAEAEDDSDDDEEDEAEVEELEDDSDEDEEEEETATAKPGGRPRKPVSSYETTGVPTLDEVTAFVGTGYNHTEEFDNPVHLQIAVQALRGAGFTLEFDSRVEVLDEIGSIKRPRGGRFVLSIKVTDKRGVKRRGKTAPVFAFVEQLTDEFDETIEAEIQALVTRALG